MEKIFLVEEMTDEAHSKNIAREISGLNGVIRVSLLFTTGKMTVIFDENKISARDIVALAPKLGCDITVF